MPDAAHVPLSKAIQALRFQLSEAIKEGEGKDIRFEIPEIELEFKCGVEEGDELNGGAKFWVLNFGGKAHSKFDNVQTVKLKLKAVDGKGAPIEVSDERDTF